MTEKKILFFAFVSSLLYRLIAIYNTKVTFFSDDAIYASLARFFYEGNFAKAFHPTWPPLYPFLSAIFYNFIKNWEVSLQIVSVLAGSLTVIPLYFLFRQFFSKFRALAIVLIVNSFTAFLWASVMPLSDMLALLFIESSLVLTFLGIYNDKPKYFLLSSVFLGLLFLTRSEGTLFFGITLLYLIPYLLLKRKIKYILGFIIIFFIVSSPYIIANRIQLGEWTMSQKFSAQIKQGHSFQLRNGTTWSQEAVSIKNPNYKSEYFRGGTDYLLEHSDWFVWWFGEKLGKWKDAYVVTTPIWFWIFVAIGVFRIFKRKNFWSLGFLVFAMSIAIPVTIFSTPLVEIRYLQWSLPLFVLLFCLGMKRLGIVITVIFLMLLPFFKLDFAINPVFFGRDMTNVMNWDEIKAVANEIGKEKSNPRIMMRHEGVEFYTNGETIYAPQIPYNELVEYAKKRQVDYFVAWDKELGGDKELFFLLDPQKMIKIYPLSQMPVKQ